MPFDPQEWSCAIAAAYNMPNWHKVVILSLFGRACSYCGKHWTDR